MTAPKRSVSQHTRADGSTQTANRLGGAFDDKPGASDSSAVDPFDVDDRPEEVARFHDALDAVGGTIRWNELRDGFIVGYESDEIFIGNPDDGALDVEDEDDADNERIANLVELLNASTKTFEEWSEGSDQLEDLGDFHAARKPYQQLRELMGDEDANLVALDNRYSSDQRNYFIGDEHEFGSDDPGEGDWIGNDPELFPISDDLDEALTDHRAWDASRFPDATEALVDFSDTAWERKHGATVRSAKAIGESQRGTVLLVTLADEDGNTIDVPFAHSEYNRPVTTEAIVKRIGDDLASGRDSADYGDWCDDLGMDPAEISSRRSFNSYQELEHRIRGTFGDSAVEDIIYGVESDDDD